MSASVHDSGIYRDLFRDPEMATLFSDTAEIRAMLLVEGALARAQAATGLVPEIAAAAIHRASLELQIDPGGLAAETGQNGVPVPALVAAFRREMKAPDYAQWVHFGATSQDIMETGLVLRLRQVLALAEARVVRIVTALGRLAAEHAALPMAGRTYGQVATPTTFGAVAAGWGAPLIALHGQLPALREALLQVSLSGAAGTLSAMGDAGPQVRAGLAAGLGLNDPGASWHMSRQGMAGLAGWATQVNTALGKLGEDLCLMTQTGIAEIALPASGGSSTMPQKQNPVMPALLVAIARVAVGLNGVMQGAAIHRQQRDGAAWFSEWMVLPQLCLGMGRALEVAADLAEGMRPLPAAMAAHIDDGTGLIHAEALAFRLARTMPRPGAQAAVKALCRQVQETGEPLPALARARFADADLAGVFDVAAQTGTAPAEARAFAQAARALARTHEGAR